MSEPESGRAGMPSFDLPDEQPQAVVRARSGISLVWLIPIVAIVIGGWLAAQALATRGLIVKIEFRTASGLEAGKTKVKFKDVDIGQVTAIDVSDDLKSVIVTAELRHGSDAYLTEKTRFWVERPRVTASGVTGLETLLSGSFIAIDPVRGGKESRRFQGLEEPPLFTTSEPGSRFQLRSPTLGSLNIGSPVYYRKIQVGQVAGFALDADGQAVSIDVFISDPNDRLVMSNSRFWNASGVDLSVSAAGVKLDTESLMSVVIGGVAFDTLDTIDGTGARAAPGQVFELYADREQAHETSYSHKERYLVFFEGSVRGLSVGAPVLLRGIRVGQVLDVQLQFDLDEVQFRIPVLIEIEPERVVVHGDRSDFDRTAMIKQLVARGLRAQLKTGSLITGQLYVELDLYPDAAPATVMRVNGNDVLPAIPGSLEALTSKVADIVDRLDAFPLEQIGTELTATLAGANTLVHSLEISDSLVELQATLAEVRGLAEQLNTGIAPELGATLQESTETLRGIRQMIEEGSPISVELRHALSEVTGAARSLRVLSDYLERHPEALLRGKGAGR
jgi:paraquat-inducible protein B